MFKAGDRVFYNGKEWTIIKVWVHQSPHRTEDELRRDGEYYCYDLEADDGETCLVVYERELAEVKTAQWDEEAV